MCVLLSYSRCVCFVQQENKNEALYLREHRGELVEELAKTIVEKVRGERTSGLRTDVRNQAAVDGASAEAALGENHGSVSLRLSTGGKPWPTSGQNMSRSC